MNSPLRAGALGAALFFASVAAALAQGVPAAPTPIPEIGRVVTADRQDEPLSATARVTFVVTKAQMLLHGYTTVADALQAVPGATIAHYGPLGAQASISIRGSSNNGVLVLLDGRPIAGAQLGTVDLGAIPTSGVERIEVVEGAGSTLYGSGASSGVVNIITRSRRDERLPLVALSAGPLGARGLAIETPAFAFERRTAPGAFAYPALDGAPADSRTNADAGTTSLRARTTGSWGGLQIAATGGYVARALGIPGSTAFLSPAARQNDRTLDAQLTATAVRGSATTTLDLGAMRSALDYADPLAFGGPLATLSSEGRVQLGLRNAVAGPRQRIVYGLDLARGVARNDGGNGAFSATPFAQAALYAQNSVRLGNALRAYGGLRAERDGAAGAALTPAAGAIVTLGGERTLRVNAATAFRVPTAEDLTFPGFSNPLLQPERTRSFDVTLDAARVLGGASLGWFVQTGTDTIVLNPAADFSAPFGPANEPLVNAAQTAVAGFTGSLEVGPALGYHARLTLTDTYRALGFSGGSGARLIDRPVVAARIDLGYTAALERRVAALGLVVRALGARTDSNGSGAPYGRVDLYSRIRLAPAALLSLRLDDALDTRYSEIPGYPLPGRTLTVELSTK